jgi:hypothetical protein
MQSYDNKLINRIKDRMLLGTIYDQIMMHVKYTDEKTRFLYSVMAGQKHRMIFYRRFKKKFLVKCTADTPWERLEKKTNKDTVWFMWLQGIDNPPDIVKKCLESQKKAMPDKHFIVLDDSNYQEYASLPDFIVKKHDEGIIGHAHFSDLIRNEILIKHGGFWIDATVFMTDANLIENVEKTDLFMYSYYYFGFNPEIMELNNWFIYSTTNNNMLSLLQKFLYEYWKDNNRASNYYIYHIFETIVTEYYEDEYKAMPIVSQAQAHVLATYIYDKYDPDKFECLKKTTGVHKLSTRFEQDKLKEKGTFYDVIINQSDY